MTDLSGLLFRDGQVARLARPGQLIPGMLGKFRCPCGEGGYRLPEASFRPLLALKAAKAFGMPHTPLVRTPATLILLEEES